MNKTSLLMLLAGTILGIGIGYVMFTNKPTEPEYFIQAEGFGKLNFSHKEKKFNIEILERIDADNLKIVKKIVLPINGFQTGYSAMEQLFEKLVDDGVLGQAPEADSPQE